MDSEYLSVKEAAEARGCSERYVRTLIEAGRLAAETVEGCGAGQGGVQYRVPLDALEAGHRLRHRRAGKRWAEAEAMEAAGAAGPAPYDPEALSAAEREEVGMWLEALRGWHSYRRQAREEGASMEEADAQYIRLYNARAAEAKPWHRKGNGGAGAACAPVPELTRGMLYRKDRALREKGGAALIDGRGKHGGHARKLKGEVWDIFEYYWLDESRRSVPLCMTLTRLALEKSRPGLLPLPSESTFKRHAEAIPRPVTTYFRYGEKKFLDDCAPYIKRMYDDIEPNDIWVADNHTFDIILTLSPLKGESGAKRQFAPKGQTVKHDGQKALRLYLTAFMDVRSRKMMGWCVTDAPCADATVYALRHGISRHGIPKMIYTDNGREFLFHDFGGNGFRRKQKGSGENVPPSILKELGIEFRTALPRNARAKGIERAFRTVKEQFSKLFEAYTGGSVAEKPGRLKEVVKHPDRLKTAQEFMGHADLYLAGIYNKSPHKGEGMGGMSPDEAYEELLTEKKVATEAQLNLMFMRWSQPVTVGKNGVPLKFYGKEIQYYDERLWREYCGKKVYVRYSPDDLSAVRVYDMEERFVCEAKQKAQASYFATKDEVAGHQKVVRSAQKAVRGYKKLKDTEAHEALGLMLDEAAAGLGAEDRGKSRAVIKPVFGALDGLKQAVGLETEPPGETVDWTDALEFCKQREGKA